MEKSTNCNWLPIKDFEMYEVSDTGLIWSNKTHQYLKPHPHEEGYLTVRLRNQHTVKWKYIHRLVGEAFIPKEEGREYIDHIDGVRDNNIVSNLRWCTKSENALFEPCIEKRRRTLASVKYYESLRRARRVVKVLCKETGYTYNSITQAAKDMHISKSCISHAIKLGTCCCGYHWQKVS